MSVYLHDIPLDEAQAKLWEELTKHGWGGLLGKEQISLDENALGRVLAEPVWATISSPHYHGAAMDGFAVRAEQRLAIRLIFLLVSKPFMWTLVILFQNGRMR